MKGFHPKGEACPGKFELPMLLNDEIERLIIFDAGDLLVLRDLSEVIWFLKHITMIWKNIGF